MKIRIEIECNNDAFSEYPQLEVKRILEQIGEQLSICCDVGEMSHLQLFDINGNKVGIVQCMP